MTTLFRTPIIVIASLLLIASVNAQSLPEFSLQCSEIGNQSNQRLASNGTEVYFASLDSKFNIGEVKQSLENQVEPRTILMSFWDGSGEPRSPRMALDHESIHEVEGRLARDTLAFQLGKRKFACEKMIDRKIFLMLKLVYEKNALEAIQKQRIYNDRPNQL